MESISVSERMGWRVTVAKFPDLVYIVSDENVESAKSYICEVLEEFATSGYVCRDEVIATPAPEWNKIAVTSSERLITAYWRE